MITFTHRQDKVLSLAPMVSSFCLCLTESLSPLLKGSKEKDLPQNPAALYAGVNFVYPLPKQAFKRHVHKEECAR